MSLSERRSRILSYLQAQTKPVSASSLSKIFGVSRQIIVGDIALLRAQNIEITATSKGYILSQPTPAGTTYTLACYHNAEQTQAELYTIVDFGATVLDVIVEHPLYGQIAAPLRLSSRFEVDEFLQQVEAQKASLLSQLTGGVHLHTIACKNPEIYKNILQSLQKQNLLYEENHHIK